MAAAHECPICNYPFNFSKANRQALCLPCGHTTCRACLSRIQPPNCPSCRAPFTGNVARMAPNYMLHELLAAPAGTSESSSLGAIAANVAVISAQVAVLQLDSSRRDAATAAAHEEMFALLRSLASRNHQHQSKQQPKQQQTPPPTQQQSQPTPSLQQQGQQTRAQTSAQPEQLHSSSAHGETHTISAMSESGPWAHPWFRSHAPTPAFATDGSGSNTNTVDPVVPNPILYVDPYCLEELFLDVNSSTVPTTFDLGGKTLQHQYSSISNTSSVVTASDVTIRNGTLHYSDSADKDGPGLHVQGLNVRLESLELVGGGWGVLVLPGGSVNISDCSVSGTFIGLGVGNFGSLNTVGIAKLEACNVKVSGCGLAGISVGRAGQARVQGCEFMNGDHHGMFVGGDCTSMLVATDVSCSGNWKRGLFVGLQGKAMLIRCKLTGNGSGCLCVQDPNSMVQLAECTRDAHADAVDGGTISWVM